MDTEQQEIVNPVLQEALNKSYMKIPDSAYKLKVFAAISRQSTATGYYRSMIISHALKEVHKVMDYTSGYFIDQDPILWTKYINESEVLILEREFSTELIPALNRYRKSNGPIIFDVDDHIHGITKSFGGQSLSLHENKIAEFWDSEQLDKVGSIVKNCDLVTTTTESMAEFYKNKYKVRSTCIRNCIDSVDYRWNFEFNKYTNRDYIVLGYMGGATHGLDLDILEEVVGTILTDCPNVKFKFQGYTPEWVFTLIEKGFRERILTDFGWKYLDKYIQSMYDVDVGLIPLEGNEFNRIGKSDLKYLEYTMAGAATIASSVGQYKECISNGYNGLLVKDTDGWIQALKKLVSNPENINKLHEHAQYDVLTNRSVIETSKQWYKTIESTKRRWKSSFQ